MKPITNQQPQTAIITSLSHEGRGIAEINGKKTFIEAALPGEEVEFIYTRKHPRFDEGRVNKIIKSSPERSEPQCQHFSICGGCSLQHINSQAQIEFKQQVLLEQLQHFGQCQQNFSQLPPLTGPAWGYRHKARLSVKYVDKKSALLIGFHEKNGRYVADLSQCEVLHPKVGKIIEPLKALIMQLSIFRAIPQIEIAVADSNAALIFRHLEDLNNSDEILFKQFGEQYNFDIYLQPNSPKPIHKIWPQETEETLFYNLTKYDLKIYFHPTDFTQINPAINEKMIATALDLLNLQPEDKVLDLFCGLGNFTLPIAKYCENVTGVEGDHRLVKKAQDNAARNSINNAQFFMSNLAQPDPAFSWTNQSYDKILLDPPRTGALEIIQYFPRWKPQKIVYVSCNPATLARDTGALIQQGYKLITAGVMDMFPHTKHVESIAAFEYRK